MDSARVDAEFDLDSAGREVLHELDRVRLRRALETEGSVLGLGLEGTILLCHGNVAFEVEFDGIEDFFEIYWEDLEKI